MERFCPKCGAKGKRFIENLCEDCFWSERSDRIPREVKVTLCSSCLSYLQGKRWLRKRDPESAATEGALNEMKRTLKLTNDTRLSGISCSIKEKTPGGLPKKIDLKITLTSAEASRSFEREASVVYSLCDYCRDVAFGKYEALVQIRGESGRLTDKGRKAVESVIEQFYRKVERRGRGGITEIKETHNGLDIKFLTTSKARFFAKKLSETTGASVTESAKMVGMDRRRGSVHYRTTLSVKLPALEVGDIISFHNRRFRIIGHHRRNFVVEDLENRKRKTLTRRSLLEIKKSNSYE